MRKVIIFVLITLSTLISNAQDTEPTILDVASDFNLFENKNLKLDFKFIDPSKGTFGIDYKVNLERELRAFNKVNETDVYKSLRVCLDSKGFVTVSGDKNQNNSIISEVKVKALPLVFIKAKKITEPKEDWETALKDTDFINKVRKQAQQVSSPLWLFLNIQAKHETTQNLKNYDFAIGSSLSVSSSYLSAILDFPFGLLRTDDNNNPRQIELSVGYDYVTGINMTEYAAINDSINNMNRLNLKAEWETGIFTSRDRISFLLDSYYNLDASKLMKSANKDWNYFYMIKLDHLLNSDGKTKQKISIKYTEGALPPNFIKGYIIGGGFSVEF